MSIDRTIAGKIKINSFTDLIGGDNNEVCEIELKELHDFKDHPFKVKDDEKMQEMVESIKKTGVLVPGVVRAKAEGGYEIIAGHRRKRACELAGLTTMPVVIRKYNNDEAVLAMIDSNLQREEILPSEKAFAYKMKLEALSHQGKAKEDDSEDVTSRQVVTKLRSDDEIGSVTGESGRQIQRYIRLTELIRPILDMVDDKKIKFVPAVELSYLTAKQQAILLEIMNTVLVIEVWQRSIGRFECDVYTLILTPDANGSGKDNKPDYKGNGGILVYVCQCIFGLGTYRTAYGVAVLCEQIR